MTLPHSLLESSSEELHGPIEIMTLIMVPSVRTKPTEKVVNVASTLAKQFRPVVLLLSAISPYGIEVNTSSDEKQETTYEVRKFSWKRPFLPIYSLGPLFWMTFVVCIQAFNIVLDIPFPIDLVTIRSPGNTTREDTLSLRTNRLVLASIGCCRLFELAGLFFSAPLLAKWLNELGAIEIDVNAQFSHLGTRINVNITRLRNYLAIFYLVAPGVFWMTASFLTFLPQFEFNWKYCALGYIWSASGTFYVMVLELMEDVKMILMLVTLKRFYSQMRSGIRHEVSIEEIKKKNVVAWDRIITKLRRQVQLAGECMKTQLILNICETVFVVSAGTYLVIKSVGGYNYGTNLGYAITVGFYCIAMAARLYIKVAIAESIYAEERLLIEDLKDSEFLRFTPHSPDALHELRNLRQFILSAPTRIPIGSFFDLDSKLLVQVIIQTIPMLIAVAQFHT